MQEHRRHGHPLGELRAGVGLELHEERASGSVLEEHEGDAIGVT
jgi:hypothetical protein